MGTQHPDGVLLDSRRPYLPSMRPALYKEYKDLPSVSFQIGAAAGAPSALAARGSFSDEERAPDLNTLERILHYSAGITKKIRGHAFRAAACTGALYHIELYVVCGKISGLDAGVYHFDPKGSQLLRLREGDHRTALAEASAGNETVLHAPVTIVYTDVYWRNAIKYQARAYRHSFWDSGTILANMLAMVKSLRLCATVVMGFVDKDVAYLLGMDPMEELPLALVPLGAEAAPAQNASSELAEIHPDWEPKTNGRLEFPVVPRIHQETSLTNPDSVSAWVQASTSKSEAPKTQVDGLLLNPLPDSALPNDSLERVIEGRGSSRAFSRDPITLDRLATLLDRSIRPIRTDYRRLEALAQTYIIVNAVESLAPGVYQVLVSGEEPRLVLQPIRLGEFRSRAAHLALNQALGGDAAVNIYYMSDLGETLRTYGERGYRLAQMEAAVMAGWGYLAAYALGVGATGLTFLDELVVDFLGDSADGLKVMFLLAVGVPRKQKG